ncbi:MAG: hypothetical protein C4518_10200 [Desulfobacteraceae bacterium]|nr:MAG: hypothetical protein C4518_10200 [Desulfobacteraceae bacterium]
MLEGRGRLPRVHDKFENTLKRNREANSFVPLFLYLAEKRVDRALRIKSVFSRLIFSRARFTDSDVLSRGLLAKVLPAKRCLSLHIETASLAPHLKRKNQHIVI